MAPLGEVAWDEPQELASLKAPGETRAVLDGCCTMGRL